MKDVSGSLGRTWSGFAYIGLKRENDTTPWQWIDGSSMDITLPWRSKTDGGATGETVAILDCASAVRVGRGEACWEEYARVCYNSDSLFCYAVSVYNYRLLKG